MAGKLGDVERSRMARSGFLTLSEQEGMARLDAALVAGRDGVVPVKLDTAALTALGPAGPPLFRGLVRTVRRNAGERVAETKSWAELLGELSGDARDAALVELITAEVAGALGHGTAADVDAERRLDEMGFDSLASVELRNRLSEATGLPLPPTLVFDHPSITALAAYLGPKVPVEIRSLADERPTGRRSREPPGEGARPRDLPRPVQADNPDNRAASQSARCGTERNGSRDSLTRIEAVAPGRDDPSSRGAADRQRTGGRRLCTVDR